MELISSIYKLYEDIGKEILLGVPDKLKVISEKHFDGQTGSFTVTLEILVLNRINDSDYGIVFSTNAQKNSHFGLNGAHFTEGLYLITDLSFGDGEIIDGTEELNYFPFSNESNMQIWSIVESFTISKIDSIKTILFTKYNISSSQGAL